MLSSPAAPKRAAGAAVGVVLRESEHGEELLFIERTKRRGDRWGGDIAFPGGMRDRSDTDIIHTARRETEEEVGLSSLELLGQLDDVTAVRPRGLRPMGVCPVVFAAPHDANIAADPREVAAHFWVPLSDLWRLPVRRHWRRWGIIVARPPGLELRGRWLWGLTYQMVGKLRAAMLP